MRVLRYDKIHKESCIDVFVSNLGKYFAPQEQNEFMAFLDNLDDSCEYFVFIEGNKVVACGGLANEQSCGVLCWGMVHRDYHNQGLGKALTLLRLERLKAQDDIKVIKIETSQHTQGFYARQGFKVTHTDKDGFGQGIDCVAMELTCRL